MEEHELSSKESVILNGLLNSLKSQNLGKFKELLANEHEVNLDNHFGDPDHGTLLDLCCRKPGQHAFVNSLLTYGANPNIVNRIRNKAPIHFAVENSDLETLKTLLDFPKTDVNILDSRGNSPLHYAMIKEIDDSILERLLLCETIKLDIINKKGKSPLLVAVENQNNSSISALLEHGNLNLDIDPKSAKIKEYLNSRLPNWELYLKPKVNNFKEVSFTHAFNLLQNGKHENFKNIIREKKGDPNFLENNNGDHTFLQYCCLFGLKEVTEELLLLDVDPNRVTSKTPSTPLMLAARKGYVDIVCMLINTGRCMLTSTSVKNETVLHHVIKGSCEDPGLEESNITRDHQACLSLLLTNAKISLNKTFNEFINQGDFNGNSALHYAARQGENEMVFCLLKAGASINCFNVLNEPAFADINYKTFKKYLDYCVYTNNKLPREDDYEIILNYSCLKPVKNSSAHDEYSLENEYNSESLSHSKSYYTFETKPLLYMTRNNELKYLLKHPIFTSFLYLKWKKINKYFYVNLLFYFIFLLAMTVYILNVYPDIYGGKNLSVVKDYVIWYFLFILLMSLVLRELAQFIIAPFNYILSLENWLEIGIIISTVSILFYAETTSFNKKVQLSVITIMLSWSELVLLIGKHPALSTYIEMLKTVSWNFLKFLAWYFALIVAFSLSFYILFGMNDCSPNNKNSSECTLNVNGTDDDFFSTPGVSLFKTIIMLTGEFDASSVPFVTHPGLSHALFIAFLFFIAIVLFNLLNGLAVSDTQAIQSDSELVGYISRVKLIAYVETLVYNHLSHNDTIFSWNFSSCWENSFLNYYKNKMTSKFINLFHEGQSPSDCKIKIYPNDRNKVVIGNKYNPTDPRCYKRLNIVEMDSSVLRAIKELLIEKHTEKQVEEMEQRKEENEKKCMEMIKECHDSIKMLTQMANEHKLLLDKLTKVGNVGWHT